jgi:hypothetical protein
MHLNGSRDCAISFSMGRGTDAQSLQVTQKPTHGAASWNGSLATPKIQYQASPGYKGADEFVFSISGSGSRLGNGASTFSGAANVHVAVDIQ